LPSGLIDHATDIYQAAALIAREFHFKGSLSDFLHFFATEDPMLDPYSICWVQIKIKIKKENKEKERKRKEKPAAKDKADEVLRNSWPFFFSFFKS
jgi:hypothetical protein